jgi:hypothetical protein
MQLAPLLCLLPTAFAFSVFAPISETTLYLHEGVGYCDSDLDETPCSFDCEAAIDMEDYDVALMCYDACVEDFPDETIENVDYGHGYCYCQTSCPSMICDSNTATLSEDYYLPPSCTDGRRLDEYEYSYSYSYSCVYSCFDDDDLDIGDVLENFEETVCENHDWCATKCNDDSFSSYEEIEYYCTNEQNCHCEDRRRLDASPTNNTHKTKSIMRRTVKSIKRANQKKTTKGRA